jgi:hypothetical protein
MRRPKIIGIEGKTRRFELGEFLPPYFELLIRFF